VTLPFDRSPLPALAGLAIAAVGAAITSGALPVVNRYTAADAIAALDVRYQTAVERNDAAAMAAILHPEFVLVLGDGRRLTRAELLRAAREREVEYERQVVESGTRTVRVFGDTAIVTARLWSKGRTRAREFEHRLWFSDTYVRTPDGWLYAFGQASLPLPPADDR
jgi:ketosteroid isomerase-like protein